MQSAFQVFNGLAPEGGPKAMAFNADLSANLSFDIDFAKEQDADQINLIQSVFIDNSLSATRLSVLVQGVPYLFKVGIGQMGIFPIISTGHFRATISSTAVIPTPVPMIFLNVPMAHVVWTP